MWLDGVIAILLAATTFYCWRLNRKMVAFRSAKKELDNFVRDFNEAILKARESVKKLEQLNNMTNYEAFEDLEKAQFLANDLAFLIHKGDQTAQTLEKQIEATKKLPLSRQETALRKEKIISTVQSTQAKPYKAYDTLANSYVSDTQVSKVPHRAEPVQLPAPLPAPTPQVKTEFSQKKKALEIEQLLHNLSKANNAAQPVRTMTKPMPAKMPVPQVKSKPKLRRFFDTLRVMSPQE